MITVYTSLTEIEDAIVSHLLDVFNLDLPNDAATWHIGNSTLNIRVKDKTWKIEVYTGHNKTQFRLNPMPPENPISLINIKEVVHLLTVGIADHISTVTLTDIEARIK